MQRSAVVLPHPDGPRNTRNSPSRTSRVRSWRAGWLLRSKVLESRRRVTDAMTTLSYRFCRALRKLIRHARDQTGISPVRQVRERGPRPVPQPPGQDPVLADGARIRVARDAQGEGDDVSPIEHVDPRPARRQRDGTVEPEVRIANGVQGKRGAEGKQDTQREAVATRECVRVAAGLDVVDKVREDDRTEGVRDGDDWDRRPGDVACGLEQAPQPAQPPVQASVHSTVHPGWR